MISPPRKLAYRLLRQIESRRLFSDDALNSRAMEELDPRDRHLTTEIVYGTLRWQGPLDYVLEHASSRLWQEVEPRARILLRMGVYQMWQLDRIPDHALVNDAVELAKQELGRGIDRYVNGVLRRLSRVRPWRSGDYLKDAPAWVRASLPRWLWDRWSARFGEKAAMEFALSLNRHPQPAFRLGEVPLGSLPFEAVPSDLVPGAAIGTDEAAVRGSFRQQDEASQLVPHILGAASGWRIWDACAAPGGKTAVLCAICGESGRVIASDLRKDRLARIADLFDRTGQARPYVLVADASVPGLFRCRFDAVLADVPCSGLGTLRRNPEIKWLFNPENLATLPRKQKQILDSVSGSIRAGGRLLYSTCSTEPEENEQVIESFLRDHPDFVLQPPTSPPGIEHWTGRDRMVRTFPSARRWDGFFAALMVRRQLGDR